MTHIEVTVNGEKRSDEVEPRLLLVHYLISSCARRPRIVMKETLQLDPTVDVVANRVPNVFIQGRHTGEHIFVAQISRLATGLDQAGEAVIDGGCRAGRREAKNDRENGTLHDGVHQSTFGAREL